MIIMFIVINIFWIILCLVVFVNFKVCGNLLMLLFINIIFDVLIVIFVLLFIVILICVSVIDGLLFILFFIKVMI